MVARIGWEPSDCDAGLLWEKEGRNVEQKSPRPECSSEKAQQGQWGVLETEMPIRDISHLPGIACHAQRLESLWKACPPTDAVMDIRAQQNMPWDNTSLWELYFHGHNTGQIHRWRWSTGKTNIWWQKSEWRLFPEWVGLGVWTIGYWEEPSAAAENVQYLDGGGDFMGKNLSRHYLRFIYFVYLCRKIKKYLLSEHSTSNAVLSPGHMGTKADRDTTCKGHAARSRIWSIEAGRPCSVPTEEASAVSQGMRDCLQTVKSKRQSVKDSWKERVKQNKWLAKNVRNHRNCLQRKMLLERSITGKFSVTVHTRTPGSPESWELHLSWSQAHLPVPSLAVSFDLQGSTGKLCLIFSKPGKDLTPLWGLLGDR